MTACRRCDDPALPLLPRWCGSCWRQFLKGALVGLGTALGAHLANEVFRSLP